MEGRHATKRPISATVTSSATARTPFTRFVPQAASSSRQMPSLPPTTIALEPQAPPKPIGTTTPLQTTTTLRGPRSIAQLRSLNQEQQDALIQGKERGKPPLQRALSFPCKTSDEGAVNTNQEPEEVQMRQLMQELRQCRYLRTSQEDAMEREDN